jgi:aspartyl-tRNA(Asn)/glutamyl-tRNA(Gln) amidotransferase subunit A
VSDPADLTLVELLPLLERRALSARELLAACSRRIDRHEPQVKAFVTRTDELAARAALAVDEARAANRPVGPLAGVPVALKDIFCTAGVPTTASSRLLAGHDPGIDATVWARLRDAGAVLVGKTVLHEFAYGTGSHPTRNPWDLKRTPGGSSGGSAAALAARMVPIATGTDTGGSLRIPAAACGVSSVRAAYGRVSRYGVLPLAESFDVPGPMARRMLDVALLLRLLAGCDPRDPSTLHDPVPDYPDDVREDLLGVRIGIPTRYFWEALDGQIERVCRAALDRLADAGAELVEVDPPASTDEVMAVPGAYRMTVDPEALHYHRRWVAQSPELYSRLVLQRLRGAAEVSGADYLEGRRLRAVWTLEWRLRFAEHRLDAVAHPTIPEPAQVIPADTPSNGPSLSLTKAWSINGFPSLSVPVGLDGRGLPVGLCLSALPEQEAALVDLGIFLDEDVQMFRRSPPPLAA